MASSGWTIGLGVRSALSVMAVAILVGEIRAGDGPPVYPGPTGEPYCQRDELYFPDGMITKVGSRIFRLCSPTSGPSTARQARVALDRATVSGLTSPILPYGLIVDSRRPFAVGQEGAEKWLPPADVQMFGRVPYRAFESENRGSNGRPALATYVSMDEYNPHHITCSGQGNYPKRGVTCVLFMPYMDIIARVTWNFTPNDAENGLIPFEAFLAVPGETLRVLAVADVTDAAEDWAKRVPVVP